jgi:hypothetical protein
VRGGGEIALIEHRGARGVLPIIIDGMYYVFVVVA